VYHFDGTSWTLLHTGGDDAALVLGVWGSSSTNVFAVAGDSRIVHYDGSGWTAETLWRSWVLSGLSGTSATSLHAVGAGTIEYPQRPTGSKILRGSGTGWRTTYLTSPNEQFSDTWSSSPTSVFAVGGRTEFNGNGTGLVMHFDGTGWATQLSGTATYLLSVWGSSPTDVFAVGFGGSIVHYDGTSWTPQASGTTQTLSGVWGTSPTNVYAVGVGGTILRYDGTAWTSVVSGTTAGLSGIWGTSATDIYVVGAAGTIRRFNGTSWASINNSGSARHLNAIWGSSSTDVFAVGDVGTVLHYDGATWRLQSSGTTENLLSVWGSSPTNVYVSGMNSILHGTRSGAFIASPAGRSGPP